MKHINIYMSNMKTLAATLLFALSSIVALAQNRTVTGVVSENLGGYTEPIYGANVVVVNSPTWTVTIF